MRLWDVGRGEVLWQLAGDKMQRIRDLRSVRFSPDGRMLACGGSGSFQAAAVQKGLQLRLSIFKQFARRFSLLGVLEDARVLAVQLPGMEER